MASFLDTVSSWVDKGLSSYDKHQDRELEREIATKEAEANAWWKFWDSGAGTPTYPGTGTKPPSKPIDWVAVSAVVGVIGLIITIAGFLMKGK